MTLRWGERAEQVHWLLSGRFLFTLSVFTLFFLNLLSPITHSDLKERGDNNVFHQNTHTTQ